VPGMLVAGRCVVVVIMLPALVATAAVIGCLLAVLVGAAGHFMTVATFATTAGCGNLVVLGTGLSIFAAAARGRFFRVFSGGTVMHARVPVLVIVGRHLVAARTARVCPACATWSMDPVLHCPYSRARATRVFGTIPEHQYGGLRPPISALDLWSCAGPVLRRRAGSVRRAFYGDGACPSNDRNQRPERTLRDERSQTRSLPAGGHFARFRGIEREA
jgi:hypothetical protein